MRTLQYLNCRIKIRDIAVVTKVLYAVPGGRFAEEEANVSIIKL
jgi:hypothetical protein